MRLLAPSERTLDGDDGDAAHAWSWGLATASRQPSETISGGTVTSRGTSYPNADLVEFYFSDSLGCSRHDWLRGHGEECR